MISPFFSLQNDPLEIGLSFANELGITGTDPEEILENLQNLSVWDILEKSRFMDDLNDQKPNPWLPCIDQAFVAGNPLEMLKNGSLNKMPVIIGHTLGN